MRLVAEHVPAASAAELTAGLLAAQAHLNSLGITRFQDACVGAAGELGIPDVFDTYRRAAADGLLSCQVIGALWWDRHRGLGQVDDLLARREQAAAGPFRATTVKLMLDGVCETFTAAMSAPYLDGHGHPTGHGGSLFIEPEMLAQPSGGWPPRASSCTSTRSATARSAPLWTRSRRCRPDRAGPPGTTWRTCSSSGPRTPAGSARSTWWPTSSRCGRARNRRWRS